ncbi:zinc-binding alcohol dehydrogenase family protein [Streptacidiphilus sp. PB12-B1b]|uniref:quinone oxidoreductase family protein n=1 Tax=Streptacidiphilus sp. PB12-B1b TaxID=2705012 RepID=UPI0015F838D0|nr:zinc-binding alcohol dehydrogenase family protein [Streptacidiphilus sp. PB12-B1b]QMU77228.1 zinc-binding alcohol dehydrogenase family protein [Streptacidiphilus sp. PB12-B1b]
MKAIQISDFGGYDTLRLVDLPAPAPAAGKILVRMRLAGVNPLDDTVRSGALPSARQLPLVPGTGGVGEIVDNGGVEGLEVGTNVVVAGRGYGMFRDGTWQEYLLAEVQDLIPLPGGLDLQDVAAFTTGVGYLTGYLALTELASFKPGQTVLAPGIGGAVGLGTVEVANRLGASLAISTASRTDKAERARAEGHEVIDLSQESLRDGVARLTGGRGVDVVVDGVGGWFTGEALASLASEGTLVSVGYSGGKQASINVTDVIWRSARIQGFMFTLFSAQTLTEANATLFQYLAEGAFHPTIARSFPLQDAGEATRHLIEDRPYGRVVLEVPGA